MHIHWHPLQGEDYPFGSFEWWFFAICSAVLVAFAGLMSGLTLGLMTLSPVDLEVLLHSGTPTEKRQAGM